MYGFNCVCVTRRSQVVTKAKTVHRAQQAHSGLWTHPALSDVTHNSTGKVDVRDLVEEALVGIDATLFGGLLEAESVLMGCRRAPQACL